MNQLSEREQFILRTVVKEYVKKALPVGSSLISEKFKQVISPATIRNDMQELEEKGYLFQPHTSAGRIPTDAGYRFYVDYLARKHQMDRTHERQMEHEMRLLQAKYHGLAQVLTRALSQLTEHVVVDVQESREREVTHNGFSYLLREPEFQDPQKAREVAEFLDHLDDFVDRLAVPLQQGQVGVSIGSENILPSLQACSMMTAQYRLPGKKQGMIVILGPTRMDYELNRSTLEAIAKIVSSGALVGVVLLLITHV